MQTSILYLLLLLAVSARVGASGCPAPHAANYIFSGRIIAALHDGIAPLDAQEDYYCYNYSLAYQVSRPPQVAISVHDFEVEAWDRKLHFYIKPLKSDSFSFIPFLIRTPWSYTGWDMITFSFLAEDRTDIQSGYVHVDSGSLAGCSVSKTVDTFIPLTGFTRKYLTKYVLFLHGFEITTIKQQYSNSPLQLKISNSSLSPQGLNLTLQVLSQTRVDSIYISYIAIQNAGFRYEAGRYEYQRENGMAFQYISQQEIGRNYARMYGLNGFVIQQQDAGKGKGKGIGLKTSWDGFGFRFDWGVLADMVGYFSYDYLFFLGSECDFCTGFPLSSEGECVAFCPKGSIQTWQNICIDCGPGKKWNGTTCIKACPVGQYLNPITSFCQCPQTLHWNGQTCLLCTNGKYFDSETRICECPKGLTWNGYSCMQIPNCTLGKIWDVYSYSCICPQGKYWNGSQCAMIPMCQGGQILNFQYQCVCKQGYNWNGQSCSYSPCMGGQLWTGTACACAIGQNYNGSMCIQCINGQKWNRQNTRCQCENGYKWNGVLCEKSEQCPGGMGWDPVYQQCMCGPGQYWSGYRCIPLPRCSDGQYFDTLAFKCVCLSGYKWDGNRCVSCAGGRVWNYTVLACKCPQGALDTGKGCSYQQKCTGGKVWVHAIKMCQCPLASVWNGNFCISNPCSNSRVWNEQFRACECPGNKVFIDGNCVPPKIACTNGKLWNPIIYACQCPPGTYLNTVTCDEAPKCPTDRIYNPMTNKCNCPFGLVESHSQCVSPQCRPGQFFNGFQCQVISCSPPLYFQNNQCKWGSGSKKCQFSYYWNGQRCIYYPQRCPTGTTWNNQTCISNSSCPQGYYRNGLECTPLPQQCVPPLLWNGKTCGSPSNLCPAGTFWSASKCLPFVSCRNGYVWDAVYLRCVCPSGTFANGSSCLSCNGDKVWVNGVGCSCPKGFYDSGQSCQAFAENKCQMITNAFWSTNKCLCRPGFTKIGFQCRCFGVQIGQLCDRCSHKINSQYIPEVNQCRCKKGYTEVLGSCIFINSRLSIGSDSPDNCLVSTYFQKTSKMCLPCPQGCLSCPNSYQCTLCRPQFFYETSTQKCEQLCGDGRKFVLECDDGNNVDGDGCSMDCRVEPGYNCMGGSPFDLDRCVVNNPQEVKLELIGQIRYQSSIVLNIRVSYVPQLLLYSSQCSSACNILNTTLLSGDISTISTISNYVPGSNNIFSVTIEFGRPYIGNFDAQIGVSKIWAIKYFGRVGTAQTLRVSVVPSYLSVLGSGDRVI